MGFNDLYPHYMETTDEKAVPLRYNRMSPKLQKVLDDEIEDLFYRVEFVNLAFTCGYG